MQEVLAFDFEILNQCNHLQEEFANGKESGAVKTMMAQLQSVNIEDKVRQPSTSS